jgi:hypothetical protein
VVFLGIVAVSSGIGLSWLERVREDARRLACANNLRQLVLATHKFHDTNGTLPPYWGAYPVQDALSVKGSWFCHLLPYVGETETYGEMMADIQKTGLNWDVAPRSEESREAASAKRSNSSAKSSHRTCQEVARYNGHRHWAWVAEGAESEPLAGPSPPASEMTRPLAAGTRSQKEAAPAGIFRPEFSSKVFAVLHCPSDPSQQANPDAGNGEVYRTRSQVWGSTNYLANWNAFANNNPHSGYLTPPQAFITFTDGLANTVLYGEGYAWCDGKGRLALNSWDYHSFGLTWALNDAIVDVGAGEKQVDFPRGMPNTYHFQVRPLPRETPHCPNRADCCDNWRAQTGHAVLNAAMADGSLREFASGTTQRVWDHALLPRDGVLQDWEW